MRIALVMLVVLAVPAHAHDLRPGILAFVEESSGELRMRFVPPVDSRGETQELPIVLPSGCVAAANRVACSGDFAGELAVGGMRGHAMKIYVSLERGGKRTDWVLTSEAPRIAIPKPPSGIPLRQLGLLAAVALAVLARATIKRSIGERRVFGLRAYRAAAYALGALAMYWLLRQTCG